MNRLGGALRGLGRFADAEPLLVAGFEGMDARKSSIPPPYQDRLSKAATRVVQLYEAWCKPEQAAAWRERLSRVLPDLPADVFAQSGDR